MDSALTARRITIIFAALLLFQASILAISLSFSSLQFPALPSVNFQVEPSRDSLVPPISMESSETPALIALSPERLLPVMTAGTNRSDGTTHRVGSGDTLASIFARFGAPRVGALKAAEALKRMGASNLRIGEEIEISIDPAGEVVSLRRELPDRRVLTLIGSSTKGYEATVLEAKILEEKRTVSGVITTSLSAAASELNIPFAVIDEFVDLFSNRVEFRRDLQPGDTFSVTYTEHRCERTGDLLAPGPITSASLKMSGKLYVAVRHADDKGDSHYYDEQGNPIGNYFLRYPVKFSRISSAFTYARFHPVLKRTRPHNGIDFAAPVGTPVRSVAEGVVEIAGYRGQAGNMIRISHGARWATAYLHLSKISSGIYQGARIQRGQVIGAVGSTGLSTGPHLHFSLYDRGNYVDPLKASLPSMSEKISPIPQEYLLAALEALDVEHRKVALNWASTSAVPSAG